MSGNGKDKKKKGRGLIIFILMLPILALIFFVVYLILPYLCIKDEVTVEVGEKCPSVDNFLVWDNSFSYISSDTINEETVFEIVGDYIVSIHTYGRELTSVIHVVDTTAPEVYVTDVSAYITADLSQNLSANDFIVEINDMTETNVSFETEPDYTSEGTQDVVIVVTDVGGNITKVNASLCLIADTEAPEISGVEELTMTVGGSISYKKGVTVTDNIDEDVELKVDASDVDTETVGDYEVIYSAEDEAGNITTVSTILHVEELTIETVTEEAINQIADELLETIITDSMTQYEKAEAIYWWCHNNISYSDNTPKNDWIDGAYRGLVYRKGDCYTYASTAKCLLTRAGIENMDIQKVSGKSSMHYWNLINIGDGWYHFDACRRYDGSTFFYVTDAELKAYSDKHNGTHEYDASLYPEIQ